MRHLQQVFVARSRQDDGRMTRAEEGATLCYGPRHLKLFALRIRDSTMYCSTIPLQPSGSRLLSTREIFNRGRSTWFEQGRSKSAEKVQLARLRHQNLGTEWRALLSTCILIGGYARGSQQPTTTASQWCHKVQVNPCYRRARLTPTCITNSSLPSNCAILSCFGAITMSATAAVSWG